MGKQNVNNFKKLKVVKQPLLIEMVPSNNHRVLNVEWLTQMPLKVKKYNSWKIHRRYQAATYGVCFHDWVLSTYMSLIAVLNPVSARHSAGTEGIQSHSHPLIFDWSIARASLLEQVWYQTATLTMLDKWKVSLSEEGSRIPRNTCRARVLHHLPY